MPRKGEWVRVYQRGILELVYKKKVTGEALRLLLYLMGQRGYGRGQGLQQTVVAEALKMSRSSVVRGLRTLTRQGYVQRLRSPMGVWLYCLSQELVGKGATQQPKRLTGKGKVVRLGQSMQETAHG